MLVCIYKFQNMEHYRSSSKSRKCVLYMYKTINLYRREFCVTESCSMKFRTCTEHTFHKKSSQPKSIFTTIYFHPYLPITTDLIAASVHVTHMPLYLGVSLHVTFLLCYCILYWVCYLTKKFILSSDMLCHLKIFPLI